MVDYVIDSENLYSNDFVSSSHMREYLRPHHLSQRLELAERALRTHEFDTLAFRGMSGAFIGPALAAKLKKEMILVRKNDGSHSPYVTEGYKAASRYIIVDDFIDSGETKRRIIEAVQQFAPDANFVGLLAVSDIKEERFSNLGTLPYSLQ